MTDPTQKKPTAPRTDDPSAPEKPAARKLTVDDVEPGDGEDVKGGAIGVNGATYSSLNITPTNGETYNPTDGTT